MLRNTLILIGGAQFLILLVGLMRAKVFSILLGPSGLGVISTIDQLIMTLTHFGALGLPYTALKFMSAKHSVSQAAFRRSYGVFARALLLLALATTTISVALFSMHPDLFATESAQYNREILFALMGVAPVMLTIFLSQTFASAQKPVTAVIFNLLCVGSLAGAAILGISVGGIAGLYIATTIMGIIFVVLAIAYLQKTDGLSVFNREGSIKEEMVKGSGVISTALSVYITLVGYSGCLLVIRYALISHMDEAAAGLLQAALAAALSFGAILTAMTNLSLAPLLNRVASETEKIKNANDFTGKILLLLLLGALPIVMFPRTILSILYTNEFTTAATALVLCVFWQCIHQFMAIYQQLLIGLNQVRYMAFSAVTGFIASGILVFVLVEPIGILAGPVSLIAGVTLSTVLILGRLILVNRLKLGARILLRLMFVGAALLGASLMFNAGSELTLIGLAIRAGYGISVLGVAWGILDDSERMQIYSMLNSIKNVIQRVTSPTP